MLCSFQSTKMLCISPTVTPIQSCYVAQINEPMLHIFFEIFIYSMNSQN